MFVRKRGVSASSGTGMEISTLLAVERRLNCALAWRKEKREKGEKSVSIAAASQEKKKIGGGACSYL